MRAERTGVYTLAAHADRALRTFAARRCAAEAYEFAERLAISGGSNVIAPERVRERLARRPGWTWLATQRLACSFGQRRGVVTVAQAMTAQQLASLVARIEVRVLLGDADSGLVSHLQTFAARELERLADAHSAA